VLVAERGNKSIGEIAAESGLEAIERGRFGDYVFPGDCADIGEEAPRTGRGDCSKDGGTHVPSIGRRSLRADPWRE
jgi:hypothetical protein